MLIFSTPISHVSQLLELDFSIHSFFLKDHRFVICGPRGARCHGGQCGKFSENSKQQRTALAGRALRKCVYHGPRVSYLLESSQPALSFKLANTSLCPLRFPWRSHVVDTRLYDLASGVDGGRCCYARALLYFCG